VVSSIATRSVNVPPVSIPTRMLIVPAPIGKKRSHDLLHIGIFSPRAREHVYGWTAPGLRRLFTTVRAGVLIPARTSGRGNGPNERESVGCRQDILQVPWLRGVPSPSPSRGAAPTESSGGVADHGRQDR